MNIESLTRLHGEARASRALTARTLRRQTLAFQGTAGVSAGNRYSPAFLDTETGKVYLARYADGRPAPMHLIDGLPRELVVEHDACGRTVGVKPSLVAGFVRCDVFYTREQAAECL